MNSPGSASGSGSSVHIPGKMNFLSILMFSTECLKVKSVEAVDFRCGNLRNVAVIFWVTWWLMKLITFKQTRDILLTWLFSCHRMNGCLFSFLDVYVHFQTIFIFLEWKLVCIQNESLWKAKEMFCIAKRLTQNWAWNVEKSVAGCLIREEKKSENSMFRMFNHRFRLHNETSYKTKMIKLYMQV